MARTRKTRRPRAKRQPSRTTAVVDAAWKRAHVPQRRAGAAVGLVAITAIIVGLIWWGRALEQPDFTVLLTSGGEATLSSSRMEWMLSGAFQSITFIGSDSAPLKCGPNPYSFGGRYIREDDYFALGPPANGHSLANRAPGALAVDMMGAAHSITLEFSTDTWMVWTMTGVSNVSSFKRVTIPGQNQRSEAPHIEILSPATTHEPFLQTNGSHAILVDPFPQLVDQNCVSIDVGDPEKLELALGRNTWTSELTSPTFWGNTHGYHPEILPAKSMTMTIVGPGQLFLGGDTLVMLPHETYEISVKDGSMWRAFVGGEGIELAGSSASVKKNGREQLRARMPWTAKVPEVMTTQVIVLAAVGVVTLLATIVFRPTKAP